MKRILKVGTRGSALAVRQTEMVCETLRQAWSSEYDFQIIKVETHGDVLQETDPQGKVQGGKGIFIKELEEALWRGQVDIAIHSCKDLPTEIDDHFVIASTPGRETPLDVLLLKEGVKFNSIPAGATIATGSPRRERQWLELAPQTKISPIRGNIDTRIRKVREDHAFVGLLLAAAGIKRLNPDISGFQFIPLSPQQMLPAPGQGALALEICKGHTEAFEVANRINDPDTMIPIRAERAFLQAMGGGCQLPMAAYAQRLERDRIEIHGYYFHEGVARRATVNGSELDPEESGRILARKLLGA